jgi:hypothetical protein
MARGARWLKTVERYGHLPNCGIDMKSPTFWRSRSGSWRGGVGRGIEARSRAAGARKLAPMRERRVRLLNTADFLH